MNIRLFQQPVSYRQLEDMMAERGVAVDHTTIWRWIQRYAPQLEKEVQIIIIGRATRPPFARDKSIHPH